MENTKEINIIDLEKSGYCLMNDYIQYYKNGIWYYLNVGISEDEYNEIFLNFFDYKNIEDLWNLQFTKIYKKSIDKVLNKYDKLLIYYNNKFTNRKYYFNIFMNALTYYIINYQKNKLNDYIKILRNNIVCSVLRKYNKNLDYDLRYKTKYNKETINRIYFKIDLLKELYNLNLGVKFNLRNINCNPKIKNLINFNNYSLYQLENNELLKFSILKNKVKDKKNYINNLHNFKLEKVIYDFDYYIPFIVVKEHLHYNLFFENIIINIPNQLNLTNTLNKTINLSPVNIINKSLVSSKKISKPNDDFILTDSDTSSDSDISESIDVIDKNNDKNNKKDLNDKDIKNDEKDLNDKDDKNDKNDKIEVKVENDKDDKNEKELNDKNKDKDKVEVENNKNVKKDLNNEKDEDNKNDKDDKEKIKIEIMKKIREIDELIKKI